MRKLSKNSASPALFAAVLALLLWSGTAIANKVAVRYMDGFSVGVFRSVVAASIAIVAAFAMRLPFPQVLSDRGLLFTSGLCSFAIWPTLLSLGIERTTAGHAALIMAMIPVFTVTISAILQRRLPNRSWWLGAALAVAATSVLILGRGVALDPADDGASLQGDLFVLVGCLVCSTGYVTGGKLSSKIGTVATTFWGLSMALVALIPVFAAIVGRTTWSEIPAEGWVALAWLALLSSLAAYALWFHALGRGGIGRTGTLQLMMPVMTLVVATILLDETFTTVLASTCIAILAGTFLAHRAAVH